MKVIVASDKFKGSLSSIEFGEIVQASFLEMVPENKCLAFPMSDGGDGFIEVLQSYTKFNIVSCKVLDPLGRMIESQYLYDENRKVAYLECALSCGLSLLKDFEKDCMATNSYGLGMMIRHAVIMGASKIFIGLGGSATNDGGCGMAAALGYEFFDDQGNAFIPVGSSLHKIHMIQKKVLGASLSGIDFVVLSDVVNPMLGPDGATYTYAKQKGANDEDLEILERGMHHFAEIIHKVDPGISEIKGAGAAGGMGAGCVYFLDAQIKSGSDFMIDVSGIRKEIEEADLIIVGEGKLDRQSIFGKIPCKLSQLPRKNDSKVIAIVGTLEDEEVTTEYFDRIYQLMDFSKGQKDAMINVKSYLKQAVKELIKTYNYGKVKSI